MRLFIQLLLLCFFPWSIRRVLLAKFFGWSLPPDCKVGYSLFHNVNRVELSSGVVVGHLNVFKSIDSITMRSNSRIGSINWISGYPFGDVKHFSDDPNRNPSLFMDEHSAITSRHLLDCTDSISIGAFSTLAGFRSQILTHSIEVVGCIQRAAPVIIGKFCFVGTGSIILAGSSLPSCSVLAAGAVLSSSEIEEYMLYAGVPARAVKNIDKNAKYFCREAGYVD